MQTIFALQYFLFAKYFLEAELSKLRSKHLKNEYGVEEERLFSLMARVPISNLMWPVTAGHPSQLPVQCTTGTHISTAFIVSCMFISGTPAKLFAVQKISLVNYFRGLGCPRKYNTLNLFLN